MILLSSEAPSRAALPRPVPSRWSPFWWNAKGADQWMQRSDTFRQYITINYTCIGNKLIYYDYIKLD